jgi:hypothetical protein
MRYESNRTINEKLGDSFMTPDIAKIGKQNFGTFVGIQKQVLDALVKADHEWIDCAIQEAKLHQPLPRG